MASSRTTAERGYGAAHQAERARWQKRMDRGEVVLCSRRDEPYCPGTPVSPTDWELDHDDDREGWLGPAHPPCNAYAGRLVKASTMIIRDW